MDKLFLDTSFLLDLALDHRPGAESAKELFALVCDGQAVAMIAPSSLKDFYYIGRRDISEDQRRAWIAFFLDAFSVVDLNREACQRALHSDEPDYEDGIVRALAESSCCTAIITRDLPAFAHSTVLAMSAEAYLVRRTTG